MAEDSNPPRRFTDSWKRWRRAIHHAKSFTDEWNGLFDPKSSESEVHRKDERTWVAKGIFPLIPETNLAVELGEFTYQLMAALDGVVFEATMLCGEGDTPTNIEALYFPLAKKLRAFNESAFSCGPLPQDLKFWVETVQPYNAGKAANAELEDIISSLLALHTCAKKDRHRRLNVLAAPPTSLQHYFDFDGPGEVIEIKYLDADFLAGKFDFLEFGITGFVEGTTTNIKLHTGLTIEVRAEEIPVPSGKSLTDVMTSMLKSVDYVLRTFEARFQ
jgi:hypothetical protein